MLFDLDADPGELRNLAREPSASPVVRECRGILSGWIKSTGDHFPLAVFETFR
jgi:hypothetical protein